MNDIRPRERDAVLQALRAGVVPRVGQRLVQVGRKREIEALVQDLDRMADGGSAFRLIVGEYGAGKTFFLNLVRATALEKRFVTLSADLTPDRRLHATGGQARSLYNELARSAATRTRPEGGALPVIVEKFVTQAYSEAKTSGRATEEVIREKLSALSEFVGGYDFAAVIEAYWKAFEEKNTDKMASAVRWLRGEYTTKTDARKALGVREIIEDAHIYDQLKLLSKFVRLAGYAGLLVCLDEMVNLFKLSNSKARNANYEQILRILNDTLQHAPEGIGFLLGGTPEFLTDTRRGLYSYSALAGRLAENTFAKDGLLDLTGPVIRLISLTHEDFFVLLKNLRHVYAAGDSAQYLLPDEGLEAFMQHCFERVGEAYFRTPRTTITSFINLLAVLEQNPGTDWRGLIGQVEVRPDTAPSVLDETVKGEEPDELASFTL